MRPRKTKPKKADKQADSITIRREEEKEEDGDLEEDQEKEITDGKFFGCYLLTSLSPRFKTHTYIGFTVNPQRRIKQHNGELRMGARRTKTKRPWEMALCIYGFPTNVAALQFEWAWQHPTESLAVRKEAVTFKSLNGVGNKIKLAYTMVNLPSWKSLNLTVNFFSTKYMKHTAGCPPLPRHMKVQVCSLDELSYYSGDNLDMYENDLEIEDDYLVGGSNGEQQDLESDMLPRELHNPESDMIPDLTSGNPCALESSLCQGTNRAEESDPERYGWLQEQDYYSPFRASPHPEFYQQPREYFSPATVLSDDKEKDSNKSSEISSEVGEASSYEGSFIVAGSMEDRNMIKPVQFHRELEQPSRQYFSPTRILIDDEEQGSKKPFGISCEIEVIDLYTPSPCLNTRSKTNGRFSIRSPEIIDLTSPS